MPTTVDAELFDSLQEAIDFVAASGRGVVRTELAETLFAKSLKLPETVKLELPHVEPENGEKPNG